MSYIKAGGTCVGCPSLIYAPVATVVSGFTFSYNLSAANGNGMLNLLMFG